MAAYCRVYDSACVSLWAWCEVVAAHACCHQQADCLESGMSFNWPPTLDSSMGTFAFAFNNSWDNVYGAVTVIRSLREFTLVM